MAGRGRMRSTGTQPDLPSLRFPVCIPLDVQSAGPAARLYTDVFLNDEPTSRRHDLDPAGFLPHAEYYVGSLVRRGLSFLAFRDQDPDPAGFIFCFDFADCLAEEGEQMAAYLAHFREAIIMIDELEARYLDAAGSGPGDMLHVFQIGVRRDARGCGIAQALIHRAVVHAAERGFTTVIADCTNTASKRAFAQCSFSEQGFLSYEAFSTGGVRFFAGLEGGISLMVLNL